MSKIEFRITIGTLRALVLSVTPAAEQDAKSTAQILRYVKLVANNNGVTATACDRYLLAEAHADAAVAAEGTVFLLASDLTKLIRKLSRAKSMQDVELTVIYADDLLSLYGQIDDNLVRLSDYFAQPDESYPPTDHLWAMSDGEPAKSIGFFGYKLARILDAANAVNPDVAVVINLGSARKPALFTLHDSEPPVEWRALAMPTRI